MPQQEDPQIPRWFPAAAFCVGVVLILVVLVLTSIVSDPPDKTYTIYRIVMSLGCAGFATALTGFIAIKMTFGRGIALMAGGSLAVFLVVYFWSPASQVDDENRSQPSTSTIPTSSKTPAKPATTSGTRGSSESVTIPASKSISATNGVAAESLSQQNSSITINGAGGRVDGGQ